MPATAVDHEHGVTPRELFFDLVFVFAFTHDDPARRRSDLRRGRSWHARSRGALVALDGLRLADEHRRPGGRLRGAALLVALVAMFLAALAVPRPGV